MEERYRQVMSRPYMSETERNAVDRIFKPILKSVDDYKKVLADPMATAEQKAAWLAALKAVQRVGMTVDRKVDQSADSLVESSVALLADQLVVQMVEQMDFPLAV